MVLVNCHLAKEPSDFPREKGCLPDHVEGRRDTRAKIYAFVIFLQFKLDVPRLGCQQIAALRFKDMSLGDVTLKMIWFFFTLFSIQLISPECFNMLCTKCNKTAICCHWINYLFAICCMFNTVKFHEKKSYKYIKQLIGSI